MCDFHFSSSYVSLREDLQRHRASNNSSSSQLGAGVVTRAWTGVIADDAVVKIRTAVVFSVQCRFVGAVATAKAGLFEWGASWISSREQQRCHRNRELGYVGLSPRKRRRVVELEEFGRGGGDANPRPTKDLGTMEANKGAMREANKVQCTQHEGSGMRDVDESWLDIGR
ncbi:hypothetical protein NL676_014351 [Syzygium grande]|nr:hypothetical protein NL676_014351 [Syzygium grande]